MGSFIIPARVCYSDKLILTTEQLAEFYGCDANNIKKNFNANKQYFTEGKHYFKVEGDALNVLRVTAGELQISSRTRMMYLWTKQGAARHAKILKTEKAWAVFELLEENYFTPKEKPAVDTTDSSAVAEDTISLEKKIEALLKGAELTNLDRLRNSLIREAAFILTGKKF